MDLLHSYRAVVCDLDGVVYRGPLAVPHAVEALRDCDLPVLYATNNASRTPETVAEHLVELGLTAGPDDVVTSALISFEQRCAGAARSLRGCVRIGQ